MAIIIKNKYEFSVVEKLVGKRLLRRNFSIPKIKYKEKNGFYYFDIMAGGKRKDTFYIKKDTLNIYELQSIHSETFYNYLLNPHSYIRPEMKIHEGDIIVDGGGCKGFFTRYALNKGAGMVIVFEPYSELAEGLEETFKTEINSGKVKIIRKALGKTENISYIYTDNQMVCATSMIKPNENRDVVSEHIVETVCLDEILTSLNIDRVDLIKMDIEGAEIEAIMGMENILKKQKPKLMIATYHEYENTIILDDFCQKVQKDYYRKCVGCYMFEKQERPYLFLAW